MPDLRGRVLQEQDAIHTVGQNIEAGLPDISGEFNQSLNASVGGWCKHYTGAFYCISGSSRFVDGSHGGSGPYASQAGFSASKSNPIYGRSSTVQPSAYAVRYLIRALP